ncbi:TonB-dependent receptor [Thermosynechococcaceae cyanobacterium BACA0444]|uniref:TonB-dependent receptor n=1 Tax=Pseudocalidococcus azoricus BACA0444 TaxID=2918990 RepID=A0AAE4FTV5_9CYAN|nr:TonB-dependent receptor [Pseudocalidococcus azoricus]MDS3862279.1 TonB-dependent receptor [Pseudocalidococcus azoricus BACA0444]
MGQFSYRLLDTYIKPQAIGNLTTGPISHQLLFGLDVFRQSYQYDLTNVQATSINLFNPVYNRERGELLFKLNELYGVNNIGLYFQDQMTLLDNLKLLVGGRFDLSNTFYRDLDNDFTYNDSNISAFTPRLGIVYQPVQPVSLYFSYSTSYNPAIFSVSQSGEPFDPEYGQQFEVGVKGEIIPNQLAATLAFYDITKQNVLTTDPNNPDFSIATGEQKSQGFEFDITGRPLPGWNLILSYAYTDAYVSQDTTIPIGSRLAGVPYNQFGFFSTYEIQDGPVKGLGFGLGLYYVGDRASCFTCDITLPSYFRVDLSTFYRRDNWQLSLNIKNLNNVEYYNTQGFLIYPQPPLTVLGTATIRF